MKRNLSAALLVAALCLGLLAGCGERGEGGGAVCTPPPPPPPPPPPAPTQSVKPSTKLDKPPQPEQIIADVNAFSGNGLPEETVVNGCEVIKRQSNPEQKEDIVYCSLDGASNAFTLSRYYVKLLYNYYDEGGWILDEMEADQTEKWEDIGFLDGTGKPIEEGLTPIISVEDATTAYYEGSVLRVRIDDMGRYSTNGVLYDADGTVLCENYTNRSTGVLYAAADESGAWCLYNAGAPISKNYDSVYLAGEVTDESGAVIDHRWGAMQAGRVGFLNDLGQEVIPFIYAQSYLNRELESVDGEPYFRYNLCEVADGTTRWIIDASGRQIYSFDIQEEHLNVIQPRGFVMTRKHDGDYVCDMDGQMLKDLRRYNTEATAAGFCTPREDGRWEAYDWSGRLLARLSQDYDRLRMVSEDVFHYTDSMICELVNRNGEYIATARIIDGQGYDAVIIWNGDNDNTLRGVMDLSGNTILPTEYEYISVLDYGLYLVTSVGDGKQALFDWMGRQRTPFFEKICGVSPQNNYMVVQQGDMLYRMENPLSAEEIAQSPRAVLENYWW